MNNFKILSFIQGVDGCGPAFVNKNKEIISKFKDYNDCINFLSMNGLYVNNETKEDIINKIEDDVKLINKLSVKIITFFDDDYPSKLLDLNNQAPAILYALGNISLLQKIRLNQACMYKAVLIGIITAAVTVPDTTLIVE